MYYNIERESIRKYFIDNFILHYEISKQDLEIILSNFYQCDTNCINNFDFENPKFKTFKYKEFSFPLFFYNNEDIDIELNIFFMLSGIQEKFSCENDNHNRFMYKNSIQYKLNIASIPVVNILYKILYDKCIDNNINIRIKSNFDKIIFTHDIDQLRSAWYENIMYYKKKLTIKGIFIIIKSLAIKIFKLTDDYYRSFERCVKIDNDNKLNSIYFFMSQKSHKDADYELDNTNLKKVILLKKSQIQFHPGYKTCNNEIEFIKQKNKLEKYFNIKITKTRQHFLKFDINNTPKIHSHNKITEDYTLGFVEEIGFRNFTSSAFYLYDFDNNTKYNVLYFPLLMMDSTITDYKKVNLLNIQNEILDKISYLLINFNCSFSILFHNTAFSNNKYINFDKLYLKIVKLFKEYR